MTTTQTPDREAAVTAPAVYTAIASVMSHMAREGISKDRRSGDGGGPKFSFRGIDDVYNALAPIMSEAGLMMLPRMVGRTVTERQTRNGGAMFYTMVEAEFDLVAAADGSKHTIRTFGEAMDSSDKSTNKAMSAAFKYAAMQAFCIPTEGDNDADATTHEVAPKGSPSIDERAARLDGAMRKQTTLADLEKAWSLASGLCADLSTERPDKLALLTKLYDARREELSGDDQSTPFDDHKEAA